MMNYRAVYFPADVGDNTLAFRLRVASYLCSCLEVVPPNFKWIKRIWDPVNLHGGGYFSVATWDSENPHSSKIWRYNLQTAGSERSISAIPP
jgi:hypothetical protein